MRTHDSLLAEALELSPDQRARLADELLRSLPDRARASEPTRADDDTHITWEGAQGMLDD
jgi:hypothetical protein